MAILLYNSNKKELIGAFDTLSLASRYLYPFGTVNQRQTNVNSAFLRKSGILNTDLNCRIVVRKSTEKDYLLNEDGYYINPNYRGYVGKSMKGFDDTRQSLQRSWEERNKRRWAEYHHKKAEERKM
jgi:hypothetical protein